MEGGSQIYGGTIRDMAAANLIDAFIRFIGEVSFTTKRNAISRAGY